LVSDLLFSRLDSRRPHFGVKYELMKVAIDSGPLQSGHKVRGIGMYTRELVQELKKLKNREFKIDAVDFEKADLGKYDIVHYTHFNPYFLTLPKKKFTKEVVTIHDLIQLIYPKQYAGGIRGNMRYFLQKYLIKRVDAIIAVSQTTKKDIVRFLDIPSNRIHVIHEAPCNTFRRIGKDNATLQRAVVKYKLPKKFVLYVGDINYNKNIPALIEACKIAKTPLVICGKQALDVENQGVDLPSLRGPRDWLRFVFGRPHPELAHYKKLLKEFKTNKDIFRLGYVPIDDLVAVYNLASVYVQPSFYEGFGLPVLEAMACETPVVIAKNNALVEVAGKAALRANPKDPKDLANKIRQVLNNESTRIKLIREGNKRVKDFSWAKTTKETVKVYKSVFGG